MFNAQCSVILFVYIHTWKQNKIMFHVYGFFIKKMELNCACFLIMTLEKGLTILAHFFHNLQQNNNFPKDI